MQKFWSKTKLTSSFLRCFNDTDDYRGQWNVTLTRKDNGTPQNTFSRFVNLTTMYASVLPKCGGMRMGTWVPCIHWIAPLCLALHWYSFFIPSIRNHKNITACVLLSCFKIHSAKHSKRNMCAGPRGDSVGVSPGQCAVRLVRYFLSFYFLPGNSNFWLSGR